MNDPQTAVLIGLERRRPPVPEVIAYAPLGLQVQGGAYTLELAVGNHCFAIWWGKKKKTYGTRIH